MHRDFDSFDAGLEFSSALASAPGIVKKEICFLSAAVVGLYPAARRARAGCIDIVLLLVAPGSEHGMNEHVARFGGRIVQRRTAAEVTASNRTILEYTWNHTTLCALKLDKSLTYIQSRFDPPRHVAQAKALERALGGEVLMHLEFLRGMDGAFNCSGLQLIRYSSDRGSRRSCASTASTGSTSTIRTCTSSRTASSRRSTRPCWR